MKEEVFTVSAQLSEANPQHICNLWTVQLANHRLTAENFNYFQISTLGKAETRGLPFDLAQGSKTSEYLATKARGKLLKKQVKNKYFAWEELQTVALLSKSAAKLKQRSSG